MVNIEISSRLQEARDIEVFPKTATSGKCLLWATRKSNIPDQSEMRQQQHACTIGLPLKIWACVPSLILITEDKIYLG